MKHSFHLTLSQILIVLIASCNPTAPTNSSKSSSATKEQSEQNQDPFITPDPPPPLKPQDYSITPTAVNLETPAVTVEFNDPDAYDSFAVTVAEKTFEICNSSATFDCNHLSSYSSMALAACEDSVCGESVAVNFNCSIEENESEEPSITENLFNAEQELLSLARSLKQEASTLLGSAKFTESAQAILEEIVAKEECEIVADFENILSLISEEGSLSTGAIVGITLGVVAVTTAAVILGVVYGKKAKKKRDKVNELEKKVKAELEADPKADSKAVKAKVAAEYAAKESLDLSRAATAQDGARVAKGAITVPDYYKVLGLDQNATPEEIQNAFDRLSADNADDASRLSLIQEAYAKLTDPDQKGNVDKALAADNANLQVGSNKTTAAVAKVPAHPNPKGPFTSDRLGDLKAIIRTDLNSTQLINLRYSLETGDVESFKKLAGYLAPFKGAANADSLDKLTAAFENHKADLKSLVNAEMVSRMDDVDFSNKVKNLMPEIRMDLQAEIKAKARFRLVEEESAEEDTESGEEDTDSSEDLPDGTSEFDKFKAYCLELIEEVAELKVLIATQSILLSQQLISEDS